MINLSDITAEDHLVICTAIDIFLEDGYNRHTNDKSVISANRKTAKALVSLLKTKNPRLNAEHFRVMYSAILDLRDDSLEFTSSGNLDPRLIQILATCNKLIPRFEKYFDSIL